MPNIMKSQPMLNKLYYDNFFNVILNQPLKQSFLMPIFIWMANLT